MRKNRAALIAFTVFVALFFTGNVAAQIGGGSSPTPLDDFFDEVADQIEWYNGDGFADFLLWIVVPFIGMYAIFRFIYAKAFDFAEENFRKNAGYGNQGLSDMADSMSKLLALSTSIIALVFWGGALGFAMLAAGFAGLAWFVWANASGLVGTTSPLPWGGGTPDTATDGGTRAGGDVDIEIGDLENRIGDIENRIGDIKNIIGDSEESGSDGEAREAAEKEETVIKSLHDVEVKLSEILNVEQNDLKEALEEAKQVIEEEKREEQGLKSIQGRYERAENTLEALEQGCRNALESGQRLTNGMLRSVGISGGGWSYAEFSDQPSSGYDIPGAGIKHVSEDLEEGYQQIQQLVQLEEQEQQQVRDEFQRLAHEAKLFMAAYDIIQKIETEIEQLESEDKELEKVAEKLGDRELLNVVEREEEQDMKLEQKLQELRDKEGMIEEKLEQALKFVEQELKLDKQQIQELQTELSETEKLENLLYTFGEDLTGRIEKDKRGGTQMNVDQYISASKEALDGIENGLQQIEQRKENEIEMLSELEDELKQAVSAF